MRITLVFLDGVGLGADDPGVNPLARAETMPQLERFMGRRLLAEDFPWQNACGGGVAVDATLGVPGLPQSATGQVSLLTGINAQAALGRHQNGFPGKLLQGILAEHSIFRRFQERGQRSTFANAFTAEYFAAVATGRWRHSATTWAALAGGIRLRLLADLLAGEAVYQDLTRETLNQRGYEAPLSSPEKAGEDLARIAGEFDFTLFEYFQTDLAGHGRGMEVALSRLTEVDRFLGSLLEALDPGIDLVLVASDHGNVEDMSRSSHTANPIPVLAFGPAAGAFLANLARLDQVTPRILAMLA